MSDLENSTNHSEIRLLSWRELQAKLGGRSYSSICRDEKAGRLPQRVRLGERGFGWYSHEVDDALLSLPRVRRDAS